MTRKSFKTKYAKFSPNTVLYLARLLDLEPAQLSGRLSGSRGMTKINAHILSAKFKSLGIDISIDELMGRARGPIRLKIKQWYKGVMSGSKRKT